MISIYKHDFMLKYDHLAYDGVYSKWAPLPLIPSPPSVSYSKLTFILLLEEGAQLFFFWLMIILSWDCIKNQYSYWILSTINYTLANEYFIIQSHKTHQRWFNKSKGVFLLLAPNLFTISPFNCFKI